VGELIRHELASIFARNELRDPDLEGRIITCSEVRVSPDLRHATVFVSDLGGAHTNEVVRGLARCRKFLRGEIGHRIETKFTPDLKFVADTLFDDAARMEALLKSDKVARDVAHRDDDDESGEEE
jgi:ribosome-binding factor A